MLRFWFCGGGARDLIPHLLWGAYLTSLEYYQVQELHEIIPSCVIITHLAQVLCCWTSDALVLLTAPRGLEGTCSHPLTTRCYVAQGNSIRGHHVCYLLEISVHPPLKRTSSFFNNSLTPIRSGSWPIYSKIYIIDIIYTYTTK